MNRLNAFSSFILLLCLSAGAARGQNARITGRITTSDGEPAGYVSVQIEGRSWGDVSESSGAYSIEVPTPGTYSLRLSAVGIQSQRRTVTLKAHTRIKENFVINLTADQLTDVTVNAHQQQIGNQLRYSIAKTPLKNLENPQVYASVSSDLIKEQGITNFDDAMRSISGISRTWESTGRVGDGAAYFALRGFEAQPSLYNGLPGFTAGDLDPANIEEIQVLKGPSGTLFGANFVGYGGIINVVTKKPYFGTGGEVNYTAGSFGLNQIGLDYNTTLSKTEKMAFRLISDYHTENSFQNAGFKNSFFLAPSFTYAVSDRLTFDFMAEIYQEQRAVAPIFFHTDRTAPLTFKDIASLNLDPNESFTSNDLTLKNPRFNLQGQMHYKISGVWSSETAIARSASQSRGYYGYIYGNEPGTDHFEQYIHKENQRTNTMDFQQNFNADFYVGSIRNRLLIGLDYFSEEVVDNGSGWGVMRYVTPEGEVFQVDDARPVYLTSESVDSLLAGTGVSQSHIQKSSYAAYVSDVINFTPGLSAMLSLRGDYFVAKGEKSDPDDDFNQFALSPKFGLVYQPVIDQVSVFANYLNTFLNVAPRQVLDPAGKNPSVKTFHPEHANQWEVGVKTSILKDRLSATLSYYDIKVENKVTPLAGNMNDFDQRGKVQSKGVDLDVKANPLPGLQLTAGYSHNHVQNISSNGTDFYTEKGRAPGGQGPQDLANLWGTYRFMKGALKDFGFGLGGNYAGIYKVVDNSVVGEFDLPAYTLINASLFYNNPHFRVTLNGNNLLNKRYYIGYWSVNPQKPVNYSMSVAFKF